MGDEEQRRGDGDHAAPPAVARPRFAESFPRDADLDVLLAAFDAGDFAQVRDGVARLVASEKEDAVKNAAKELLARTKPDPLSALLLLVSALLLVLLSAWWVTHNGPSHPH